MVHASLSLPPYNMLWNKLFYQLFVVWLRILHINTWSGLRVQIELIEYFYPFEHFAILCISEICVGSFSVPWIERVKANDVQRT